jgi:hypothetical protein
MVTVNRLAGYPALLSIRYPAIKSGIRPDTGSLKRPNYPAGYPADRIRCILSNVRAPCLAAYKLFSCVRFLGTSPKELIF